LRFVPTFGDQDLVDRHPDSIEGLRWFGGPAAITPAWRASPVSITMTIHGSQEPTTEATMDKFLVLYRAPNSVVDEWMKKPEQERKPEETMMMDAWKKWMSVNASNITDKGAGAGKPKVVSSSGVKDARNDIMMYQIVQANSADEAAKMFVGHPHFGIPQATIEVMPLKAMEG
jgi:hypothetical protein